MSVTGHRPGPASYSVVYAFNSPPDGNFPTAGLIDVKGTLFGTSSGGGAYPYGRYNGYGGTVFSVTTDGLEKVLHSFGNGTDGRVPSAPLVDVNGKLYGTTSGGGAYAYGSYSLSGTVFSITTDGVEKVLHSFGNGTDGAYPIAGLIDVKGTLYGTTSAGGYSYGTVFCITTDGTEKVLHRFGGGTDGAYPGASLIDVNGELYGTTGGGGVHNSGTVFRIDRDGAEEVLHSFGSEADGSFPDAPLIEVNGTLFGTTEEGGANTSCGVLHNVGCGTVFRIAASGAEKVLHSFGSRTDGVYPQAGLLDVKGTLYGTTSAGGAHGKRDHGTVFSVTTDGVERVLHRFGNGTDGAGPEAALINLGGTLYGTTIAGGASNAGVVFALTP